MTEHKVIQTNIGSFVFVISHGGWLVQIRVIDKQTDRLWLV